MADFPFTNYRHRRVTLTSRGLELGGRELRLDESLDFGAPVGAVLARDLARAAEAHAQLAGACPAQLAALAYTAGAPRALDWYFPITAALDGDEIADFYRLIAELTHHAGLDVRLIGEGGADLSAQLPADSHAIVAGHLAEIFFYRRDILDRFLIAPRRLSPRARST